MSDINNPETPETNVLTEDQLDFKSVKLLYTEENTKEPTYTRTIRAIRATSRLGYFRCIKKLLRPIKD